MTTRIRTNEKTKDMNVDLVKEDMVRKREGDY